MMIAQYKCELIDMTHAGFLKLIEERKSIRVSMRYVDRKPELRSFQRTMKVLEKREKLDLKL